MVQAMPSSSLRSHRLAPATLLLLVLLLLLLLLLLVVLLLLLLVLLLARSVAIPHPPPPAMSVECLVPGIALLPSATPSGTLSNMVMWRCLRSTLMTQPLRWGSTRRVGQLQ
jgi:hypothetical protein